MIIRELVEPEISNQHPVYCMSHIAMALHVRVEHALVHTSVRAFLALEGLDPGVVALMVLLQWGRYYLFLFPRYVSGPAPALTRWCLYSVTKLHLSQLICLSEGM